MATKIKVNNFVPSGAALEQDPESNDFIPWVSRVIIQLQALSATPFNYNTLGTQTKRAIRWMFLTNYNELSAALMLAKMVVPDEYHHVLEG